MPEETSPVSALVDRLVARGIVHAQERNLAMLVATAMRDELERDGLLLQSSFTLPTPSDRSHLWL